MADLEPPDPIRVYLNTQEKPADLRIPGKAVPLPSSRFWTVRKLSNEMRRNPPDLLFVPSYVIPPIHPPSVVTIHDLGYLVEPESHNPAHRKQLEWSTRWNVHASRGIIAISETTKQDLVRRLGANPDSIRVIYHGISPTLAPASSEEIEAIRTRHGIGDRAILAVGSIHPRKNLVRLIQAFELLAAEDAALQLVLCGAPGWNAEAIVARAQSSPFRNRILHLGYVHDPELPALYGSAAVFAFPSLYEGFGMPALEAMACGVPVVAANRAALPEICGAAALLVDPFDSHAIAGGLQRMLNDEILRNDSIARGFQRARYFRWQDCASETLAFLRSIGDNWQREVMQPSERGRE